MKINFVFLLFVTLVNAQYQNQLDEVNKDDPEHYLIRHKKKLTKADSYFHKGLYSFYVAKNFEYLDVEDSTTIYLKQAKEHFKTSGDLHYEKAMSLELQQQVRFLNASNNFQSSYFEEFYLFAKEANHSPYLALAYLELSTIELFKINNPEQTQSIVLQRADSLYQIAKKYNNNASKELNIRLNILKGGIETNRNNLEIAKKYYDDVLKSIKTEHDLYLVYAHYNLGYVYLLEDDIPKAIEYLKKAEKSKIKSYKKDFLVLIYIQLANAYERNNQLDLAISYKNKKDSLQSVLDKKAMEKTLILENYKHQTKFKHEQFKLITDRFKKNKILYLSLIFVVFLLALYSFIRWKKEDRKKKVINEEKTKIEKEHLQTKVELEKTKLLVIKDHILLKNKSKVYLNELIYIKSEDHYLQLITNNKVEFVRGKLSEIMEQLPPNFVKCHRSYIINKNEMKQILTNHILMNNGSEVPFSRGFKS